MPPKPSSPLPRLPPDVLLLVLDTLVAPLPPYAPDHAPALLKGQADLARLSRVCKALRRVVRPYLYSSVNLSTAAQKFLKLMKVSLHSEYVASIAIVGAANMVTAELLQAIHLFPALSSVTGLYGRAIQARDQSDARSMSRPRLSKLGIDGSGWEWDTADQYFNLGQLDELAVLANALSANATARLLDRLPETLTVLKLDGCNWRALDDALPTYLRTAGAGERLRVLWLHPRDDPPTAQRDPDIPPRPMCSREVLKLVPALHELSISCTDLLELFAPPSTISTTASFSSAALTPMPRHLRTLRLGGSPVKASTTIYSANSTIQTSAWFAFSSLPAGQPSFKDLASQLQTLRATHDVLTTVTDVTLWDVVARGKNSSDGWPCQQALDALGIRLVDRKGQRFVKRPQAPPMPVPAEQLQGPAGAQSAPPLTQTQHPHPPPLAGHAPFPPAIPHNTMHPTSGLNMPHSADLVTPQPHQHLPNHGLGPTIHHSGPASLVDGVDGDSDNEPVITFGSHAVP